jgi:hypothetical protein
MMDHDDLTLLRVLKASLTIVDLFIIYSLLVSYQNIRTYTHNIRLPL